MLVVVRAAFFSRFRDGIAPRMEQLHDGAAVRNASRSVLGQANFFGWVWIAPPHSRSGHAQRLARLAAERTSPITMAPSLASMRGAWIAVSRFIRSPLRRDELRHRGRDAAAAGRAGGEAAAVGRFRHHGRVVGQAALARRERVRVPAPDRTT